MRPMNMRGEGEILGVLPEKSLKAISFPLHKSPYEQ
jgi:hypothetical protein